MRILITLPWGERLGGAEAMLQMILAGAHAHGHEPEPVFFEDGPWPAELRDAGLRVTVLAAGRLRDAHRWALTVGRLARIMRRRQPHAILNWAAKTQLYGAPAALLAGMPERVVWWQQLIPDGHWLDRCATALPAAAVGCYSQAAAQAQARLWPGRPTFVVAAGSPIPDRGAERTSAEVERVAVAPAAGEGSAAGEGCPPLSLPSGVPLVGLVGRLQPWKGQDRLLRAQALLRERGREIHTLIVGGAAYGFSADYAASLPPLIASLGLQDAVTMTDHVPNAGLYIECMDVLVNASDPEPFGIVLLEGMAREVTVLAVDSGGPAEFVEHGRTGILARSGEPAALADALEELLALAPDQRTAIARAGRERFLSDFTDSAMCARFFDRLETAVGGSDGR